MANPDETRRVAVVAIHGVGEHKPGELSQAVTAQLLSVCGDRYSAAQSSSMTLDVDMAGLIPAGQERGAQAPSSRWARLRKGGGSAFLGRRKSLANEQQSIDQRFTSTLLLSDDDYQSTYTTSRQSLTRTANEKNARVDIHELYWSDLSHGGNFSSLKLFDQFTQLLLHIAGLGRSTLATVVDDLESRKEDSKGWRCLYQLSAAGYWLLTMPILQGNLLFLLLAGLMAPVFVPEAWLPAVCSGVLGLEVAFACGILTRCCMDKSRLKKSCANWLVPLSLLLGVVVGGLSYWLFGKSLSLMSLVVLEAVLLLAVSSALMFRYDKSRPGTLPVWGMTLATMLIGGIVVACNVPNNGGEIQRLLSWLGHMAECVFIVLVFVWLALYLVNALLLLRAFIKVCLHRADDNQRRAVGTALIAASVPPSLLLSVILMLWCAGYYAVKSYIPCADFTPWLSHLFPNVETVEQFLAALINQSATSAFMLYLVLMVVAMLLVAWAVLPSVKAEILHPNFRAANDVKVRCLGSWLDGGFLGMKWAAFFAGVGFFIVLPAGVICQTFGIAIVTGDSGYDLLHLVAPLFGAGATGFLGASKLLAKNSEFIDRIRVIVDIALDVDNWLRERPRGETPRLHIFARFNALLHQLEKEQYDKIVIVAHSQGSVVAVDFFRYLKHQLPARHSKLPPIKIFTIGCPLRQLYAARLPMLYSWVNRPSSKLAKPIGPDPADCGFVKWVNAYGSGDYVGRYLWAADTDVRRWNASVILSPSPLNTEEFCIGAQAHTHYFDVDNVLVARKIDALLA